MCFCCLSDMIFKLYRKRNSMILTSYPKTSQVETNGTVTKPSELLTRQQVLHESGFRL